VPSGKIGSFPPKPSSGAENEGRCGIALVPFPEEAAFSQPGPRVRIRLPPAESPLRTCPTRLRRSGNRSAGWGIVSTPFPLGLVRPDRDCQALHPTCRRSTRGHLGKLGRPSLGFSGPCISSHRTRVRWALQQTADPALQDAVGWQPDRVVDMPGFKPGGSWMIVEPMAGDRLEDNLNPVGRIYYAGSYHGMRADLAIPGGRRGPRCSSGGHCRRGETRQCLSGAPCRASTGERLGGRRLRAVITKIPC
jgi:hypothetical protein